MVRVRFGVEVRVWVRNVVQVRVLSATTCLLVTQCTFRDSAVHILPVASGWTVRYELLIHMPYVYTLSNTTSAALTDGSSSLWSLAWASYSLGTDIFNTKRCLATVSNNSATPSVCLWSVMADSVTSAWNGPIWRLQKLWGPLWKLSAR